MGENTARSHHPDSIGLAFLWTLVSCLVLVLIAPPAVSLAEIVTNITPTLGNGTNLFHSFNACVGYGLPPFGGSLVRGLDT